MSIQSVLDDNKTVIPEGDYLRCSNELRDIYATTNDFYKLTYIFTEIVPRPDESDDMNDRNYAAVILTRASIVKLKKEHADQISSRLEKGSCNCLFEFDEVDFGDFNPYRDHTFPGGINVCSDIYFTKIVKL